MARIAKINTNITTGFLRQKYELITINAPILNLKTGRLLQQYTTNDISPSANMFNEANISLGAPSRSKTNSILNNKKLYYIIFNNISIRYTIHNL